MKDFKDWIKELIPFILVAATIIYLALSFILWELNPAEWESEARACAALLWLVFMAILFQLASTKLKP